VTAVRSARARATFGLVAASLLLTGCDQESAEDAARRLAVERARRHNAVAGAAITLLVVLLVRHAVAFLADEPSGWHAYRRSPLPGLLLAAALAGEVVGSLLFALVGGGAGYVLGRVPPGPSTGGLEGLALFLAVLFLLPFAALAVTVGIWLVRLPARLPDVATSTFFWAAVSLVVAGLAGLAMAGDRSRGFDGWHLVGAVLAGEGALGAVGYGYGVAVRRRQSREARALRRL
jgi:hypothetical protein